jgi:hypothetical protein
VGVLLAIPLASAGWTLARDLIALRKARQAAGPGEDVSGIALPGDDSPDDSVPAADAYAGS